MMTGPDTQSIHILAHDPPFLDNPRLFYLKRKLLHFYSYRKKADVSEYH